MPNEWFIHLKKFREKHPNMSLKEAMQGASKTYKKSGSPKRKQKGKGGGYGFSDALATAKRYDHEQAQKHQAEFKAKMQKGGAGFANNFTPLIEPPKKLKKVTQVIPQGVPISQGSLQRGRGMSWGPGEDRLPKKAIKAPKPYTPRLIPNKSLY